MKHYILTVVFSAFLLAGCINFNGGINVGNSPANITANVTSIFNITSPNLTTAPAASRNMLEILQCEQRGTELEIEQCFDSFIAEKMRLKTTVETLIELDQAAERNSHLRIRCHDVAHAIGRNNFYSSGRSISTAFGKCSQICHAGCYHGALQAFFLSDEGGNTSNSTTYNPHIKLEQLKAKVVTACAELAQNRTAWFQCLHGMGHAVEFFVDNNLTSALGICDELHTEYERQSCYGGIFMENVVSVKREKRWINTSDPLFPCNAIEAKYKYQCYLMQTAVMLEIYGENIPKIIETCAASEDPNTCFTSLGRDRSNEFRIHNNKTYEDLELIGAGQKVNYLTGLVYALDDNTWNGFYAFPFCSGLANPELKHQCYSLAVNYLVNNLGIPRQTVVDSCQQHAPREEKELCLQL